MDTGEILNRLKQSAPGGVLEKGRFGRSAQSAAWVESRQLPEIAKTLKEAPEIALDWVENLSAIQMDEAIVLTYFLRSSVRDHALILRVSAEPAGPAKEVDLPTVAPVWAMAAPFEEEIRELFGVRFLDSDKNPVYTGEYKLAKGWNGYPLRKGYVFPTEFLGVRHMRRMPGREGNA